MKLADICRQEERRKDLSSGESLNERNRLSNAVRSLIVASKGKRQVWRVQEMSGIVAAV